MLSIGLDIGTTSICGILHDATTGEVYKTCTLSNDTFLETANDWEKTQDTKRILDILTSVLDELLEETTSVVSIGITGQMHGIVYLNADGEPVSPLVTWQDGRGNLIYENGMTYAEYMTQKTGYPLATGYGSVTFCYDMVNRIVPKNAVTFCTIHDLAAMKLAGNKTPLIHSSDAASMGLFDIEKNCFDKKAVEKLGLRYSMFPNICNDFIVLGIYRDIPVSVAIGDNQASFLGSVSDMEESMLVNVGTGSQISCLTHSLPTNRHLDCRPLLKGNYIVAGSSLCGGRAYAMLEKFFREIAKLVSGIPIESAYPVMNKLMENYSASTEPVLVDTTFSGTRVNPQKRGSIHNIGINNLDMASFCDGFMCGIVKELQDMFCEIESYLTEEKLFMIGSGNGIRNNVALRAKFEKSFGLKMKIPLHKEEAAFGASLYALVTSGVYSDIVEAQKLIKYIE